MRTKILCHINEKKKSKVCLVKCFRQHFLQHRAWLWHHFYLLLNEMIVSVNQNGLLFKKITFKILNEYNRFQETRYQHFHKWHVAKICGRHRVTIQNCKATWTSLLTKKKAKSTLTMPLLCPNCPKAWALIQGRFRQVSLYFLYDKYL